MKNLSTVYFICSPSLGILDNWLPVISQLKSRCPNAVLVCVITKSGIAELIDPDNVLIRIADNLFDSIIYKSNSEQWFECISFDTVKDQNTSSLLSKLLFLFKIFFLRYRFLSPLVGIVKSLYGLLDFFSSKKKIKLNKLKVKDSIVLYDIYEETKEYNRELLECFIGIPKFSINHGINIEQKGIEAGHVVNLERLPGEISAFLFSKDEKDLYKKTYSLKDSETFVIGVPRHNKEWVAYLHSMYSDNEEQKWGNYIFLISRSMSEYFPLERKVQAIQDIKKLAFEDLGLNIIVKLHPKERDSELYKKIFGKDAYGVKWKFSNTHPFLLGNQCIFAIAFFSGIVFDMAALKVPAIEFLNLKGLKEFDNKDSLRDKNGEPVLDCRYLNIVLGASNYEQLKSQANYVINNRSVVVDKFYKRYCELFVEPDKSISLAIDQIIK